MRKRLLIISIAIVLALSLSTGLLPAQPAMANPGDIYVDASNVGDPLEDGSAAHPFDKIQEGIDAASGVTVYVLAGTYYENITLKNGVTVQGAGAGVTTIDGGGVTVVTANSVDSAAKLDGFTITNGDSHGIYNYSSSPTITNNTIAGNSNHGIYNRYGRPTITNNTITGNTIGIFNYWYTYPAITNNTITGNVYGIFNDYGRPTITNNTITGNTIGIHNYQYASPTITNNTITGNGNGINNDYSSPKITNNIITGNSFYGIRHYRYSSPTISYNDVWGNGRNYYGLGDQTGINGNISADPLFEDPTAGDYHLQPSSPCIDAGSNAAPSLPSTDFEGDPRIWDGVVDMGADEYVPNLPPVANAGGPYVGNEGSEIIFDASASSDPDGDPLQYRWDFENDGTWDTVWLSNPTATNTWYDDYSGAVKLEVRDGALTDSDTAGVTVNNVAPTVDPITAPIAPVAVGTPITASADFTDPGTGDTHTAEWDWSDGMTAGTVTEAGGSGSVTDNHTYTVPGVYTITLTVTDDDGGVGSAEYQYVVVYDPSAGFVTGGGWIDSPEGAYIPNPSLTGKANFGFVSKYKKGADTPSGNTEFQFKVANLNFHSASYQWLVIAGPHAKFKGSGTINSNGDYGFMLTATDGQLNGGGGVDKFRIKIWDKATDVVIYDNQLGDADDAEAAQAIAGGSIVIHTKDK